jgi:ribosome-associated protein
MSGLKAPNIEISPDELRFSYSRSSGSGGQHVNKVETKVELRFNISQSNSLTEPQKSRLLSRLKGRLNSDGDLVMSCQETRSQGKNKVLITERLHTIITQALKPVKARKRTKPTLGSVEKRLLSKKKEALKKSFRKKPDI